MVQWLRLPTTIAEGTGLILRRGTKNPRGMWHGQKRKRNRRKRKKIVVGQKPTPTFLLLLLFIKKQLMKVKEESEKAGLKFNIQKN